MKKRNSIIALNIVLPLVIGLLIYIFLKHGTYINVLFNYESDIYLTGFFGNAVISWATDILWAYSLSFLLFALSAPFKRKYPILITEIIFFIIMEMLQKYSIITGTFDIIDIAAEILAMLFVFTLYVFLERSKIL